MIHGLTNINVRTCFFDGGASNELQCGGRQELPEEFHQHHDSELTLLLSDFLIIQGGLPYNTKVTIN